MSVYVWGMKRCFHGTGSLVQKEAASASVMPSAATISPAARRRYSPCGMTASRTTSVAVRRNPRSTTVSNAFLSWGGNGSSVSATATNMASPPAAGTPASEDEAASAADAPALSLMVEGHLSAWTLSPGAGGLRLGP